MFSFINPASSSPLSPTDMSRVSNNTDALPRGEGVAFFVAFALEFVAIIVANIFTICIFRREPNLKQAKFYLLINLAVADLFVGLACVPFWTFNLAFSFRLWPPPRSVPLMWRRFVLEMAELWAKYASLICLTMIAVERMFATLQPIKYRLLSRRTRYGMIAMCWVLAAPFSLNYTASVVLGVISHDLALYLMLGGTCLLLLVTALCYLAIWLKIKSSPNGSETSERKLSASLFIVTVVSLATWLPNQVFFSVKMSKIANRRPIAMETFIRVINVTALLLFFNSVVNPIIYAFRIPHFKKHVVKIFCGNSGNGRRELQDPENHLSTCFNR